ncbi:MAG: type II toxin-antitoxin system VapC family toxin [Rhodobacteraceae bacterium]|nr:type II toxin-antitoxin system VapC family toxin [Paracoccaceae bacterium]MCY4195908.1 type II toxin-antitoxin system VapC family toxin [Paracoccaceae bacterium]MCY4326254.1 type II toxin-antitoxin system VapC family toxin [Paracoccaceae bacterium]
MYLLDTNVISAGRRPKRRMELAEWLYAQADTDLFISVISLGEIARGIRLQEARNAAFAATLTAWLTRTETLFTDRILPFGAAEARIWGHLSADLGHPGADLMIAATALTHHMTVVTGNVSDFRPTGVDLLNPFKT